VDALRPTRLAAPVTLEDHVQRPFDADVTLLQYGDYECPDTRLSRHGIRALQRELQDRLRFVFRTFTLQRIHPHATAAESAAAQEEFWVMHEYLFDRDRTSPGVARRIDRDLASGERSGVEGTPTFYVNGVRHDGRFDMDSPRSAIMVQLTGVEEERRG
jgi:protein-disulfide isomerase